MVEQKMGGVFYGRTRVTKSKSTGGARHVTPSFQGLKNDLVYLLWGGQIANPFPGAAKLYVGDMFYQELDDKAENPKLYMLKTYEVVESAGTTVKIVKDGYHHIPFVGDTLMVSPDEIGGAGTVVTVIARTVEKKEDGTAVWVLTTDAAISAKKGDILVEGDKESGEMLVKDINAFAPYDYDFVYEPVADPDDIDDYENADYQLTPVVGFIGYIHRMSPIPPCVLKLNQCRYNGVFAFNALHATV